MDVTSSGPAADDLLAFAAVVEAGGFSAAARTLTTTRQSVHRRVMALETATGLRLLERTTRRVRPTDAGRRLYARAVAVREALEAVAAEVRNAAAEPSGLLRISGPPLLSERLLPPVVVAFCQRWPAVTLELRSEVRLTDLVADDVDLAIRVGHLDDPSLIARRIGSAPQALVASPHLEGIDAVVHPFDLARLPTCLFGPTPGSARGIHRFQRGEEVIEVPMRQRLVSRAVGVIRAAVLAGLGVAWLPRPAVDDALAAGELVEVLPEWWPPPLPLHVILPSRTVGNPTAAAFVQTLEEVLSAVSGDSRA